VLYLVAVRAVFVYEQGHADASAMRAAKAHDRPLSRVIVRFMIAAAVVVAAGLWLPFAAIELAAAMGWSRSFVGTLFVAFATSVPELAVTVSALRLGALDLAIGNLLGSNLFNVAIIAIDDLFYTKGPLLAHVSPVHAMTAGSAVIMTGLAVVGLFYRPTERLFRAVGWISLGLFSVYLLNTYVIYLHGD
jgi:cation:H+ antiporter